MLTCAIHATYAYRRYQTMDHLPINRGFVSHGGSCLCLCLCLYVSVWSVCVQPHFLLTTLLFPLFFVSSIPTYAHAHDAYVLYPTVGYLSGSESYTYGDGSSNATQGVRCKVYSEFDTLEKVEGTAGMPPPPSECSPSRSHSLALALSLSLSLAQTRSCSRPRPLSSSELSLAHDGL